MPHRCLDCSRSAPDGTDLAAGCSGCGGRAFWHVAATIIVAQESPRGADNEALWSWESREAWLKK